MKSNVPARAFAARSLVGQTMGARKRLAFWEVYAPFCEQEPSCGETPPASWRRRSIGAVSHSDELRAAYLKARAKYRIGERLRPCVLCHGPSGVARCKAGHGPGRPCPFCEPCGTHPKLNRTRHTPCDGSGVISKPAEKASR